MNEIIKIRDSNYDYYESLILQRDKLKKEAFNMQREYVRVFGYMILEIFKKKIECIRKKKTISYLQTAINRGETVNQDKLNAYLKAEMDELQQQLNEMIQNYDAAQNRTAISESDSLKIRKLYRRLAKLIHPDLNPNTNKHQSMQELWHRICSAYNRNDLKSMEELEILVQSALEQCGENLNNIEIPDIEEKLMEIEAEIEKIKNTDPYQYKFILDNDEMLETKKEELAEELYLYEEYSMQLEEVITKLSKGVFICHTN